MKILPVLLFLFSILIFSDARSQFYNTQYRLPGQQWQQVQSDHFRVIYPERYQELAARTLTILELEYADIQSLVGGKLRNFPVILNPENDQSNGFVSPVNFRSEIEIAPIIGKNLNPRSGGWLEAVVPHELVHALHLSANPASFTRALGLFSPDLRRSVHSAAPFGFLEGIAVEHESHNTMPESGRGNYPYFTNQLNAMIGAKNSWSMGQLVHTPVYTPPFNRHYIGGYHFIHWLQNTYGRETMQEAINWHYKYPILGFGLALRATTGRMPAALYDDFMTDQRQRNEQRLETISVDTDSLSEEISFSANCRRANRPLWVDGNTLLFYGRSCNRSSGFYLHNFETQETNLLYEVSITGDYNYVLTPDKNYLIYSRYHANPIYDNVYQADLHRLDLQTGKSERITKNKRLTAPSFLEDSLFALQTTGEIRQLVIVDMETGTIADEIPMEANSTVMAVDFYPGEPEYTAILGKKQGIQAIWFANPRHDISLFSSPPDIVFEGSSVFDPQWHATGETLLFTSDAGGAMNVYEYDIDSEEITQRTESRYNVYEGSYSPDGSSIAYILQRKNEQLPQKLDIEDSSLRTLSNDEWGVTPMIESQLNRPLLNREAEVDSVEWQYSSYKTGMGWLKPRIWLPEIESIVDDADRVGIRLESVDPMSQNAYSMNISHFANKFWFDGTYRYTGRYPGFELQAYNEPVINTFLISGDADSFLFNTIAQRRGATLSIPFRYRMEQNVQTSSFLIEPEFSISQTRYTDVNDARKLLSDYESSLLTTGLNTILNLGLRQHTRDVQPNSGITLFTQTRYGLNSQAFSLQLPGGQREALFPQRKGFRAGLVGYMAPLGRWNQSMRISLQAFTQTERPVFNTRSQIFNLFDPAALPGVNNTGIINTRYTIPIIYPDNGGLLLPLYLSNIYVVLFSQTVADLSSSDPDQLYNSSRSVYGAGIRTRFKLSNLQFDIGISVGWEPTRNRVDYLIGSF